MKCHCGTTLNEIIPNYSSTKMTIKNFKDAGIKLK